MTRRISVIRVYWGWVLLNILSWKVLRGPLKDTVPATCFLFLSIHSLPLALVPVCPGRWVTDLAEKMPEKIVFEWFVCLFFSDVHIVSTLEPLSNAVKRNVPRCTITPVLLEQARFRISVTCPSFVQTTLIRLPKDVSTLGSNDVIRISWRYSNSVFKVRLFILNW